MLLLVRGVSSFAVWLLVRVKSVTILPDPVKRKEGWLITSLQTAHNLAGVESKAFIGLAKATF
jgi:hypothetical protein